MGHLGAVSACARRRQRGKHEAWRLPLLCCTPLLCFAGAPGQGCCVLQVTNAFLYLMKPDTESGMLLMLATKTRKAYQWLQPKGNMRPVAISLAAPGERAVADPAAAAGLAARYTSGCGELHTAA